MFTEDIVKAANKKKYCRYWLISDLQQGNPANAERYFTAAVNDLKEYLTEEIRDLSGVCYLGDAAEGIELDKLKEMTDMQVSLLEQFNVPIYYVMGNHELDYFVYGSRVPVIPFYEAVKDRKLWHLVPTQEDFYFVQETDEFTMLFFSDHLAKDGSWCAVHQNLPGETFPDYPHTKEVWQAVRDRYANTGKPVFTFAHCAFPGGNRPSEFLEQLLPLPDNFRAHFHGHAHIGDEKWAGKDVYRQIAGMDNHPQLQFDISSLDHLRGTTVRSAFFDYYGNGEYGVFFRDHLNHRWEQTFVSSASAKEAGIPEQYQ